MEVDIYEKNYWYCKCRRLIEVFTLFKRLPVQKDTLFKTLELYTLFKTQDLENHTLFSGSYLYRPNKGVPPPGI